MVVRDASPDLEGIPEAVWFGAFSQEALVGVYALVPKPFGWWRCHMTVAPALRDEVTTALVQAVAAWVEDDAVVAGGCEGDHHVLRSALEQAGYEDAAQTEVIGWSRRVAHPDVGRATPAEHDHIARRLGDRGVHWAEPLLPSSFLVLRDAGEIVAGVVVHRLSWHVDALGPMSWLTLPLLRGLGLKLDPLGLGAFLGTFGRPEHVELLWQGALHHTGLPLALVGADPTDPRWKGWSQLRRGAIGRVVGTSRQHVYARGEVPRPLDWGASFLR